MSGAEFDALVQDIEQHGQQVHVVVSGGRVLDGRNRLRACEQLGIAPKIVHRDDIEEATAFVLSMNLAGRHLSAAQRAAVAVLAGERFRAEARERQRTAGGDKTAVGAKVEPSGRGSRHEGRWSTRAAKATGAGSSGVTALDAVRRRAPDVFNAVHEGLLNVRDATRLSAVPPAQRAKIIGKLRDEPKLLVRNAIMEVKRDARIKGLAKGSPSGPTYALLHGDAEQASVKVKPGSCGLVLADPPYAKESIALVESIGRIAARVLRPGGSLIVMCGGSWLPETLDALRASGLTYQWALSFLMAGKDKTPVWGRSIITEQKPILWFVRGRYKCAVLT
jgi:ParB-like chromosome segregation protein Spo0J